MTRVKVVRPSDEATVIEGAGDEYRYLATGAETAGAYFMMEAVVPPGGGPPPHIQTREEEGFYVMAGSVTFWVDDQEVEAGAGTFLNVPRGVKHNFKNQSAAPARMLIHFAPAGIEAMFSKMGREPERYLEIAAEYGVRFPESE